MLGVFGRVLGRVELGLGGSEDLDVALIDVLLVLLESRLEVLLICEADEGEPGEL